ncbi:MAG: tetratricopeptide repeat protein [Clostridiaceae bacterium]|nr:tetratricopeptide repeat protein [Clostridiaceae bacterium]
MTNPNQIEFNSEFYIQSTIKILEGQGKDISFDVENESYFFVHAAIHMRMLLSHLGSFFGAAEFSPIFVQTGSFIKLVEDARNTNLAGQIANKKFWPHMFRLVLFLEKLCKSDLNSMDQAGSLLKEIDQIISSAEHHRIVKSDFQDIDIQLSRRLARIFRIFAYVLLDKTDAFSSRIMKRDRNILLQRGINSNFVKWFEHRAKIEKQIERKAYGKAMVLAEEWETICIGSDIIDESNYFELKLLAYLDGEGLKINAIEWLKMLISRHPEDVEFTKMMIKFLIENNQYQEAAELCDSSLVTHPTDKVFHFLRSQLHFQAQAFVDSERSALMSISSDETFTPAYLALAYACLGKRDYNEAISAFNRTIEVDSTVIDAYRGKSKSLSAIGQEYDAMYTIKKAISIEPNNPLLHHDLANLYYLSGYFKEAKACCKNTLRLNSGFADAYVLLGLMDSRNDDFESSVKWFSRALTIEPDNVFAINELAYSKHMLGEDEESLELLENAFAVAPDYTDLIYSMAVIHFSNGDYDEARILLDRSLSSEPDHVGSIILRADDLLFQSLPEEALVWFERAIDIEPQNQDAIQGKVDALQMLGLSEEASELEREEQEIVADFGDSDD